jgi:hypothetical protein
VTRLLGRQERVRWQRYLTCATCGASAGEPCWRMPAPRQQLRRYRSQNRHPHQGRIRSKEKCRALGYFGGAYAAIAHTECNLPPGHGGIDHVNASGQRWRIR